MDKENVFCKADLKMESSVQHRAEEEMNEKNTEEPEEQHEA